MVMNEGQTKLDLITPALQNVGWTEQHQALCFASIKVID